MLCFLMSKCWGSSMYVPIKEWHMSEFISSCNESTCILLTTKSFNLYPTQLLQFDGVDEPKSKSDSCGQSYAMKRYILCKTLYTISVMFKWGSVFWSQDRLQYDPILVV